MTVAGSRDGIRRSVFVVAPPGVEPVLAREVGALGLEGEAVPGGVALAATPADLYALNLHLRTATRVLVRVAEFRARTFFELERHAAKVPWREFTGDGSPVRLRVTSRKSRLYHQRAIEQRLRAAIDAPVATEAQDEEADGDREQLFIVRFLHDRCVISADSSGALLHRRGYRQAVARAPLRENLAAAMLLASGWTGAAPLLDPLCGSGTIPIEAALIARRIAPGARRARRDPGSFAFTTWPDFQPRIFEQVLSQAEAMALPEAPVRIVASDRDAGAIAATEANAARAGVAEDIEASVRAVSAVDAREPGGWLVTNPPYGARVGDSSRLRDLYAALGQVARRAVPGGRLVMLSADPRLEAAAGLEQHELLSTRNGGIPVRVMMGAVPSADRGAP